MTPAQEILRLIETVDPNDTAKMDEIDARVNQYLLYPNLAYVSESDCNSIRYTRSRDALKQIRPKGYSFRIRAGNLSNNCKAIHIGRVPAVSFSYQSYRTEELAELHAIIQAVEFERSKT